VEHDVKKYIEGANYSTLENIGGIAPQIYCRYLDRHGPEMVEN
jgi:hypothetical protein